MRIGRKIIGRGRPAYLLAELSGNHNGELERALAIVRAAAVAGADGVKLQTYTADTMTFDINTPEFTVQGDGPWAGRTLYDLYREAYTPWDWHKAIMAEAAGLGLDAFSTPFDESAVEFLEELKVPAYKIASFELVDDALLRVVAGTRKPVIVSTGMASREEIVHAVDTLRDAGGVDIVLLRCTSSYPAPDDAMRLQTIEDLRRDTGCEVGLSDHSVGTTAPIVAVTLGACLIEKHLTLRRADGGVDSHFSLEPQEFGALVRDVRRAEAMLSERGYGAGTVEQGNLQFRRSLYFARDLPAGAVIGTDDIRAIRPGFGLAPRHREEVVGRRLARAVTRGTRVSWDALA